MATAAAVKELALVPVRSTVYVVKLPFVLVWMLLAYICALLYSVVTKIVSVPVSYVKRAARRIQLTWNWTKSSTRAVLPWNSNAGTERALAVRRQELEDYQFYDTETDLRYGLDRALRRRGGRRSRRKAIISSLIRILLDPVSPAESEEEPEIVEDDEDGKVYKLIRDLVQFSRSRPHSSLALQCSSGHVLDIETLRQHARDKEKLQTLISELDQYVKEMDTGRPRMEDTGGSDGRPSGHGAGLDDEQEMFTPDLTTSSIPDTDMYMDASEREGGLQASGDESEGGEEYGEEFDDAHSTVALSHLQCRGLSPVAEVSPEAVSVASSESLDNNYLDLESELNTALSRLNTLTDELTEVEVSVLESMQTKITETVTITSVPEARQGDESRKNSTESSYEDAEDDFPSIPKTSPILGLEAGHSKRNLATARKARPPSLPKGNHQQQECLSSTGGYVATHACALHADGVGDKDGHIFFVAREDSKEFEEESEVEEEDDRIIKLPPGAGGVPPSLSDQFQLLTPSSSQQDSAHFTPSPQTTADLYSTVKKAPRSRSEGEGEEDIPSESERGRSQSVSSSSAEKAAGKSLFMHDLTPPWKQMRSRNSSSNSSDSLSATPSHAAEQSSSSSHTATQSTTTPPPLPSRSYTPPTQSHLLQQSNVPLPDLESRQVESPQVESPGLYDRLPRVLPPPPIPSKAGEEGLYDIIPGGKTRRQPQYLHEKMASRKEQAHSTPPVSWTPQLPPRNDSMLKRSGSAEVMGNIVKDLDRQHRHGSERRLSTSLVHEHRARSNSSSSSKRVHSSSTERDQERKVKRDRSGSDDRHHHSRSSESSPGEKHKSSSSRSSSTEKHRSSSGRSSSSEKHGSSSSEKHGSSSSEKHGSSSGTISPGEKQRSSSEKHRSSDKRPSPPSSKSSESSGSFVWKILSSAASSKKKSSSPTEKSHKGGKEEKKEREKENKHPSSRSRESKELSRESGRTHQAVSQRDAMPRNESSSSLKSGVSMHSSDSSGRESLV